MENNAQLKTAVVIGGTGALGRAVCKALCKDGYDIGFSYSGNRVRAEELEKHIKASGRSVYASRLELTDPTACRDFMDEVAARLGAPGWLIYASGPRFSLDFVAKTLPQEWCRVIDADLKGFFNITVATLPYLRQSGYGALVAITAASVAHVPARDALSAAPKSAITSLIKSIAIEEGRYGIRANCVAPGFIDAGFGRQIVDDMLSEQQKHTVIKSIPLRRQGRAEEVANAVTFLCSDKASYVTGSTIFVSGGSHL